MFGAAMIAFASFWMAVFSALALPTGPVAPDDADERHAAKAAPRATAPPVRSVLRGTGDPGRSADPRSLGPPKGSNALKTPTRRGSVGVMGLVFVTGNVVLGGFVTGNVVLVGNGELFWTVTAEPRKCSMPVM